MKLYVASVPDIAALRAALRDALRGTRCQPDESELATIADSIRRALIDTAAQPDIAALRAAVATTIGQLLWAAWAAGDKRNREWSHTEATRLATDEVCALLDTGAAEAQDWPDGHKFLPPPHPDGQYVSSALCSCGQWQWDGESEYHARGPESITDWQRHAAAVTRPDPGEPRGTDLDLDVDRLAAALKAHDGPQRVSIAPPPVDAYYRGWAEDIAAAYRATPAQANPGEPRGLDTDALPTIANSRHGTLTCVPGEVIAVVDMAARVARPRSPLAKAVAKARTALRATPTPDPGAEGERR